MAVSEIFRPVPAQAHGMQWQPTGGGPIDLDLAYAGVVVADYCTQCPHEEDTGSDVASGVTKRCGHLVIACSPSTREWNPYALSEGHMGSHHRADPLWC